MGKKPPADLPEGFTDIWNAIAKADEAAASRQALAGQLGISTNTIQRILVDGAVPDFTIETSNRILNSWTRIVTRLALYFKHDPFQWVIMVNIKMTDRISEVISKEISRKTAAESSIDDVVIQNTVPGTDYECESSFFENLGRKMLESIALELKAKNLAKEELLKSIESAFEESKGRRSIPGSKESKKGKYCLSCLAPLSDEHNAGASEVYCRYCSDENGALLPRDKVLEIIAEWFRNWQKDLTISEARRRADHYMRSMPAWNQVTVQSGDSN